MFFLDTTISFPDQTVNYYLEHCGCLPDHLAKLIGFVYSLIRVGVPIILIFVGILTLASALMAQKEDSIAKAQSKLIKKVVAAAIVFLVTTILQFAINLVAKEDVLSSTKKTNTWDCVNYMLNGKIPSVEEYKEWTVQECQVVKPK